MRLIARTGLAVIVAAAHGGAALADIPPPPPVPPAPEAGIALEFAGLYGRTLGAASECSDIPHDRVDAVADKAQAYLRNLAKGDDSRAMIGQRFSEALYQGASSVRTGQTICAQAEADLDNLDHELSGDAPAPSPGSDRTRGADTKP